MQIIPVQECVDEMWVWSPFSKANWRDRYLEEQNARRGGGCILMVSQGREPLWAPPLEMAALEKPAREEQQKMTIRQMTRHKDSYLGALQLWNCLNYDDFAELQSNSIFPLAHKNEWPLLIYWKPAVERLGTQKGNRSGPISPTSRSFSVAVTTTRTRGGNLGCWTALCRYNTGFRTKAVSEWG